MNEPLTPPDCDLRGMPFMPLDVVRLLDSDLVALSTGDEFKAAVLLWCKAWNQLPAGSLPDDDRILAHLSGAGARWARVRTMALHSWVKCSDGRLYHAVIAEKAREAWAHRLRQRERSARGNAKRWGSPSDTQTHPACDPHGDATAIPGAIPTASQGTVKGQLSKKEEDISLDHKPAVKPRKPRASLATEDAGFAAFWHVYPRKEGKGAARKAWTAALAKAAPGQILAALDRAAWNPDPRYIPHPATWLNQERWTDAAPRDPVLSALGLDFSRDEPETDPLRLRLQ